MTVVTPPGKILRDQEGVRLEFIRTYDEPIVEVWSALTDPERVSRWLGDTTGDPATGTVELLMTAEQVASPDTVKIVDCAAPSRLVVDLPSPGATWRVEVSLSDDLDTTTLTFIQRLAEADDPTDVGPGWHFYLDRLGAVVAGTSVPENWDEDYFPALKDAYALPS
jgi:uncharacterized protein YndB with AHSA1/START domain